MNPDKSKKITGKVLLIMKNVIIKQTILGRGMPKICAPLVEKDYESLIHQAASFTEQPVDIAEWRADWFDSILEPDTLDQVLPGLESALKDIPLLFTFRTQREGGHVSAPLPAYRSLVEQAIRSALPRQTGEEAYGELLTNARQEEAASRALERLEGAQAGLSAGVTPDALLTDV